MLQNRQNVYRISSEFQTRKQLAQKKDKPTALHK